MKTNEDTHRKYGRVDKKYYNHLANRVRLTRDNKIIWNVRESGVTYGKEVGSIQKDSRVKINVKIGDHRPVVYGHKLAFFLRHRLIPHNVFAMDGNYRNYADKNLLGLDKHKSLYINIFWDVLKHKWVPMINDGMTTPYLGHFKTEQEAIDAYNEVAEGAGIQPTFSIFSPKFVKREEEPENKLLKPFVPGVF